MEESPLRIESTATQQIDSNYTRVTLSATNESDSEWCGLISHRLGIESRGSRFFLPGFMYGRNRPESPKGVYPRLDPNGEEEFRSPFWSVRSDRLSHPLAAGYVDGTLSSIIGSPYIIEGDIGLKQWNPGDTGDPVCFNGFSCSCDENAHVGYTLGSENLPGVYLSNYDKLSPPTQSLLTLKPGESITYDLLLSHLRGEDERIVNPVVRRVYDMFHQPPRPGADQKITVEDITRAICRDTYLPELRAYSTQVHLEEDHSANYDSARLYKTENGKIYLAIPSIAWTGGVECATPVLMAAHRTGNDQWREQALDAIQNIVDNSYSHESGLPYDAYDVTTKTWTTQGWWHFCLPTAGHSSYLVGQALFYILKAWDTERTLTGTVHSDWLSFVERCLTNLMPTQNKDGAFPYLWDLKGKGIDYDGFAGCWCLAAAAYYTKITGDAKWMDRLFAAERWYHENYVVHVECYGTPHDTYKANDSEGILAYVRACGILHQLTQDARYLSNMVEGLEYEFTYKFCYNPPIQFPPLNKLNWSCSGGSITSTCNPHIHPMSSSIIDEMEYAYRHTKDKYLARRLKDTVEWSLQAHNTFDGEFDFGLKGWATERYCYSEGLVTEKYEDETPSSVWFCYLPWAASCFLEGLCGVMWES